MQRKCRGARAGMGKNSALILPEAACFVKGRHVIRFIRDFWLNDFAMRRNVAIFTRAFALSFIFCSFFSHSKNASLRISWRFNEFLVLFNLIFSHLLLLNWSKSFELLAMCYFTQKKQYLRRFCQNFEFFRCSSRKIFKAYSNRSFSNEQSFLSKVETSSWLPQNLSKQLNNKCWHAPGNNNAKVDYFRRYLLLTKDEKKLRFFYFHLSNKLSLVWIYSEKKKIN